MDDVELADRSVRRAVVTGGVSYHDALTGPDGPFVGFDRVDVHGSGMADLEAYALLVVLRSVDGEALRARRFAVRRFLDRGGVLVTLGEAPTSWFPGCRWEPETADDLEPPLVADHPLLAGADVDALFWHRDGPRWCSHGHLVSPVGAEVLVGNGAGGAWLYIDRASTRGVILAATNLDFDAHAYYGNELARVLLDRVLRWAEAQAEARAATWAGAARRIAGVVSGVHFQQAFFEDAEFGERFAIVPADELTEVELGRYAAIWVPRESDQARLMRARDRISSYLTAGGTLVVLDEIVRPWLSPVDWRRRRPEVDTFTVAGHPILAGIAPDDVRWHGHGVLHPADGALTLVGEGGGEAVLALDERTWAPGRVLLGTLDPDAHIGYGSDRPRPLVRGILRWIDAGRRPTSISKPVAQAART